MTPPYINFISTPAVSNPGGADIYIVGHGIINQYSMLTPWDISTMSFTTKSTTVAGNSNSPSFSADGFSMYTSSLFYHRQYDLSSAWSVDTAVDNGKNIYTADPPPLDENLDPVVAWISPDGLRLFSAGTDNSFLTPKIVSYTLLVANDVTSAQWDGSNFFTPEVAQVTGLFMRDDGLMLYLSGNDLSGEGYIYEYSLSGAYDLSTISATGNFLKISGTGSAAKGVSLSPDGLSMYVGVQLTDPTFSSQITQFTLSSSWNLSTAVDSGKYYVTDIEDDTMAGIYIRATA